MKYMVRRHALAFVSVVSLSFTALACGKSNAPPVRVAPPQPAAIAPEDAFANDEAKDTACLALRDHVVVLFADDWAEREGVSVTTPEEKWALYTGLAQQLEDKGTLKRFAASCMMSLTPKKFECGMIANTTTKLVQCMKHGANDIGAKRTRVE